MNIIPVGFARGRNQRLDTPRQQLRCQRRDINLRPTHRVGIKAKGNFNDFQSG